MAAEWTRRFRRGETVKVTVAYDSRYDLCSCEHFSHEHVRDALSWVDAGMARRLRNGSDWSSLALVDKTRREILAAVEIVLERGGEA